MRYKTFEVWMKEVKNLDVTILKMPTRIWDKYLDEYNEYKNPNKEKAHS